MHSKILYCLDATKAYFLHSKECKKYIFFLHYNRKNKFLIIINVRQIVVINYAISYIHIILRLCLIEWAYISSTLNKIQHLYISIHFGKNSNKYEWCLSHMNNTIQIPCTHVAQFSLKNKNDYHIFCLPFLLFSHPLYYTIHQIYWYTSIHSIV